MTKLYFIRHQDGASSYWKIEPIAKTTFVMVSFLSATGRLRQAFPMQATRVQPMLDAARKTELTITLVTETQE